MDLSLQLYSARNEASLDRTLITLKQLGYTQVEGWGGQFTDPAALAASLKTAGLTMPTAHIGYAQLENTDAAIAIARLVGIKTIYCPAPPTNDYREGKADWSVLARGLARIGEALDAAGIGFGYHNHNWEFRAGADGKCPIETLLDASPVLQWEMDLAWLVRAGEDPLVWMDKLGDRITAIHVKDIAPAGGALDEDGWADVGFGTLDWKGLLTAAQQKTRARYFVMEHDKPLDAMRFARRSIEIHAEVELTMARTYGVGIIGAGNISTAYLQLAPLFKGLEVRAIADLVADAAQARGKEFGVTAMTPDEMLANSEIDVVVNLTIPQAHYRVSMDAISAGKHVYSEKPFVLTLKEGKALKRSAHARGLSVGSAPDTFLGGAHQQVRDMIDRGQVGMITHGTAHVMGRGMEHWHPNPTFFFRPGGGPILDMGPYYITDLVQLLGPVRRVTAFTGRALTQRTVTTPNSPILGKKIEVETPTTIHGVLEFHSGALITIGASWDTFAHGHHNIELYGTEGSIFVPDPNFFGGEIVAADKSGGRRKIEPWDHPFGRPNHTDTGGNTRANYRAAGLADMMQAVDKGRPARCGIDVALHVVDVMTALLRAGETGKVMTLTTTCARPRALKPKDAAALLKRA